MDEGAFIDPNVFFNVIVPMLSVRFTTLMCITSPQSMENWYTKVIRYKDENGEPLVTSAEFRNVCPKCRLNDPRDWPKCTHVSSIPDADHKSIEQTNKWNKVYEAHGLEEVAQRENLGIVTENEHCCFNPFNVERCFSDIMRSPLDKSIIQSGYISSLYCCIDPNGGSMNCSYTAMSIGYKNLNPNDGQVSVSYFLFYSFFFTLGCVSFEDRQKRFFTPLHFTLFHLTSPHFTSHFHSNMVGGGLENIISEFKVEL